MRLIDVSAKKTDKEDVLSGSYCIELSCKGDGSSYRRRDGKESTSTFSSEMV
ncbi:hypothetical protein [Leptospira alstonii]|uniref:hypothetical protein n=1 Tax=Leptospira alstonii TaxID=28452 RepID=UPI000B1BE7BD|nr:hypothetical protein [Leptospira alstonii]